MTSLPLQDDQHSTTVKINCAVIKVSSDTVKNTVKKTSLSSYEIDFVLKACIFTGVMLLPKYFQSKSHRMQTGKTDSIQHICKNYDSFYIDIVQVKSFSIFLNHILIAGTQSFGTSYFNSQ